MTTNTELQVALFDYGAGNLHSLKKALEAGGARVVITGSWDEALAGDALVLPGVGSFGAAVRSLEGEGPGVRGALQAGLPCLGICLGMQLFYPDSEEGAGEGIGLLEGTVRRLRAQVIPQMGWNDVETVGVTDPGGDDGGTPPGDPLFTGISDLVAYYANSYVCAGPEAEAVIATTDYQGDSFPAAVRKANTWGVQFHPEKSSGPGLRIIRNFLGEVERLRSAAGARGEASS
jgi:glutamine amidotransferase